MRTPASIPKHPIHPMLIVFPIGLWVFSLISDVIFLLRENPLWNDIAFYTMIGGLSGALLAAIPRLTLNGKTSEHTFSRRDQFAPELLYFSDCIIKNREPEPSGSEGLADIRVIEALYRSARIGKPVKLSVEPRKKRPILKQEIHRPPVGKAKLIHAESASA